MSEFCSAADWSGLPTAASAGKALVPFAAFSRLRLPYTAALLPAAAGAGVGQYCRGNGLLHVATATPGFDDSGIARGR